MTREWREGIKSKEKEQGRSIQFMWEDQAWMLLTTKIDGKISGSIKDLYMDSDLKGKKVDRVLKKGL